MNTILRKIISLLIILVNFLSLKGSAQTSTPTNLIINQSCTVANNVGCPTFNRLPNCSTGWVRSHGTPQFLYINDKQYNALLISTNSGSEGMFKNFTFRSDRIYDINVTYTTTGGTGILRLYAANNLIEPAGNPACQALPQISSISQEIGGPNNTSNTPIRFYPSQNFSQFQMSAQKTSGAQVNFYISLISITEIDCINLSTSVPSNLSAAVNPGNGYYIHFTPVPNVTNYFLDWFDLTTNTQGGTTGIAYSATDGPSNLFNLVPAGHSFKFRLAAATTCGLAGAVYSAYSTPVIPNPCALTLNPNTLVGINSCGTGNYCSAVRLDWPTVPNAVNYQVEYQVFNINTGVIYGNNTLTTTNNYAYGSFSYTSNLVVHLRVRAQCAGGVWGAFTAWSPNYPL